MLQKDIVDVYDICKSIFAFIFAILEKTRPEISPITKAIRSSFSYVGVVPLTISVIQIFDLALWYFLLVYMFVITIWFFKEIMVIDLPINQQKIKDRIVSAYYLTFVGFGLVMFWILQTLNQFMQI